MRQNERPKETYETKNSVGVCETTETRAVYLPHFTSICHLASTATVKKHITFKVLQRVLTVDLNVSLIFYLQKIKHVLSTSLRFWMHS